METVPSSTISNVWTIGGKHLLIKVYDTWTKTPQIAKVLANLFVNSRLIHARISSLECAHGEVCDMIPVAVYFVVFFWLRFIDIPSQNRSCPLGLGSPDYDVVLQSSRFAFDAAAKNNTADFSVYDEMVTGIVPVFALAWSENATVQWSDARIMCLSTPNITDGSRKPSGVPNSSMRLSLNLLIVLGSVMFWIIICWSLDNFVAYEMLDQSYPNTPCNAFL